MDIKFTKMHGLGNDFVVIDAINQSINLSQDEIRKIADRNFGVGCDQLLLVEEPKSTENDFRYRIFNADGGEVEQCGNGARCFAQFVYDHIDSFDLENSATYSLFAEDSNEKPSLYKAAFSVETINDVMTLFIKNSGFIIATISTPIFDANQIPFKVGLADPKEALMRKIYVDGKHYDLAVLSMGNPHAVMVVKNIDLAPVGELGPKIESHSVFPNRVNVGFMQIINRHEIALRVYERGVGETLACGSGACAAVVAGIKNGELDSPVNVRLRGGEIEIEWGGGGMPAEITGPAYTVFEGIVDPDKLQKRPQP